MKRVFAICLDVCARESTLSTANLEELIEEEIIIGEFERNYHMDNSPKLVNT